MRFAAFINGEIDPEGNEVPEQDRVKLQGVWLQPSSKRYYLYSSLASGVLGFVKIESEGSVGLEPSMTIPSPARPVIPSAPECRRHGAAVHL